MKGLLLSSIFLCCSVSLYSQQLSPSLETLINAENGFAAFSKNNNTRDAFLAYLSDSTVLFEKGKPIKGKQSWIDRKRDSSLLFWWPVFAGIAKNGDMGFTTGPWEWSKQKQESTPLAFGYYATVWQKQKDGAWKMAADIGISFKEPEKKKQLTVTNTSLGTTIENSIAVKNELLEYDKRIIQQLNKTFTSFSPGNYTNDAYILRNGHWPFINSPALKSPDEKNIQYSFTQLGGDISSSQDFGYTYGTVAIKKNQDGKEVNEKACYMRIWKKEDGKNWKIVLDIIGGE